MKVLLTAAEKLGNTISEKNVVCNKLYHLKGFSGLMMIKAPCQRDFKCR